MPSINNAARPLIYGVSAVAATAVTFLVHRYGFRGTLRLLWEGDHLPPEIRDALDILNDVEQRLMPKEQHRLEQIEVTIETAKLNSVDGPSGKSSQVEGKEIRDSNILEQSPRLKKDLSTLSDRLDKLAAKVDSVRSRNDPQLKNRKKCLSSELVSFADRCDSIISSL